MGKNKRDRRAGKTPPSSAGSRAEVPPDPPSRPALFCVECGSLTAAFGPWHRRGCPVWERNGADWYDESILSPDAQLTEQQWRDKLGRMNPDPGEDAVTSTGGWVAPPQWLEQQFAEPGPTPGDRDPQWLRDKYLAAMLTPDEASRRIVSWSEYDTPTTSTEEPMTEPTEGNDQPTPPIKPIKYSHICAEKWQRLYPDDPTVDCDTGCRTYLDALNAYNQAVTAKRTSAEMAEPTEDRGDFTWTTGDKLTARQARTTLPPGSLVYCLVNERDYTVTDRQTLRTKSGIEMNTAADHEIGCEILRIGQHPAEDEWGAIGGSFVAQPADAGQRVDHTFTEAATLNAAQLASTTGWTGESCTCPTCMTYRGAYREGQAHPRVVITGARGGSGGGGWTGAGGDGNTRAFRPVSQVSIQRAAVPEGVKYVDLTITPLSEVPVRKGGPAWTATGSPTPRNPQSGTKLDGGSTWWKDNYDGVEINIPATDVSPGMIEMLTGGISTSKTASPVRGPEERCTSRLELRHLKVRCDEWASEPHPEYHSNAVSGVSWKGNS